MKIDLKDLPLGVPVVLHSVHRKLNLENAFGTSQARCLRNDADFFECVVLTQVGDDKISIASARNRRLLGVRTNGDCFFDAEVPSNGAERFHVESHKGFLFFVSCLTGNVLQCDQHGAVRCDNTNRLEWEQWLIKHPKQFCQCLVDPVPNAVPNTMTAPATSVHAVGEKLVDNES